MSHAHERKEKNCLNCGITVVGRYCHVCGQENIEPKESFWHLVTHFFNDITHFDGKFFTTLKDLLLRPGFLTKEYMLGRRASYLNPIRMYVFTSAIFFLLFFSFFKSKEGVDMSTIINGKSLVEIDNMDDSTFAAFTANINKEDKKPAVPMSRSAFKIYKDSALTTGIHIGNKDYKSKEEYDSALASGKVKHGWLQRKLIYKQIELNKKYNNDPRLILNSIGNSLLHSLPQMLFLSLPMLALILKLMYVRRRKQFYYVSHVIFSVHLYVFFFIALLVLFSLSKLNDHLHWGFLSFIFSMLILGLFVYQYLALKNFYRQGWFKTFLKFILINIPFLIVLCILFVVFVGFSFFNI